MSPSVLSLRGPSHNLLMRMSLGETGLVVGVGVKLESLQRDYCALKWIDVRFGWAARMGLCSQTMLQYTPLLPLNSHSAELRLPIWLASCFHTQPSIRSSNWSFSSLQLPSDNRGLRSLKARGLSNRNSFC